MNKRPKVCPPCHILIVSGGSGINLVPISNYDLYNASLLTHIGPIVFLSFDDVMEQGYYNDYVHSHQ